MLQLMVMTVGVENPELARVFYSFVEDMYMQFWTPEYIKMYYIREKPKDAINT